MISTQLQATEDTPFVPFTKAERIQQLNDIDKSITSLLRSAGLALQSLTASQSQSSQTSDKRQAFQATANEYIKTLQAIDVRLKRQILGLEEADIVPKETPKVKEKTERELSEAQARTEVQMKMGLGGKKPEAEEKEMVSINEGSMGRLDTGWLNSRSGKVGWGMEAELWAKARRFAEEIQKDTNGQHASVGHEQLGEVGRMGETGAKSDDEDQGMGG